MAQSSNVKLFWALAAFGMGGLLFYYGRKRKDTLVGRMKTAAGISLLLKAVDNPILSEHLGPLPALLKGPLEEAEKMLG